MSIRAIAWVLYEAEIDDHADFRLLTALADRASDDGTGAFPSVESLAKRMRRTERSVQRGLRKLVADGWVRLGDQSLVAHYRADRRPTVYDLVMNRVPGDIHVTPSEPNGVTQHVTPSTTSGMTTDVTPLDSRGDIQGPNGVTSDVTQTVPSLLRNETVQRVAPSAPRTPDPDERTPRKRAATRLPADWQPTPTHRQFCEHRNLDLAVEARKFKLHAEENDRRVVVWNSAFSRWLENARPRPLVTAGVSETGRLWQD